LQEKNWEAPRFRDRMRLHATIHGLRHGCISSCSVDRWAAPISDSNFRRQATTRGLWHAISFYPEIWGLPSFSLGDNRLDATCSPGEVDIKQYAPRRRARLGASTHRIM